MSARAVPKSVWGPVAWNRLHSLAIRYPRGPLAEDKLRALSDIADQIRKIPCPRCQSHALEYINQHPIDVSDTYALQSWVWRFHNSVNARLGKPEFTFDAYLAKYSDQLLKASIFD